MHIKHIKETFKDVKVFQGDNYTADGHREQEHICEENNYFGHNRATFEDVNFNRREVP